MLLSDSSSVYTAPDSVDLDEHDNWNPMMKRLFHAQIGEMFVDEIDVARTAFSCRVVLDLLCNKGGCA